MFKSGMWCFFRVATVGTIPFNQGSLHMKSAKDNGFVIGRKKKVSAFKPRAWAQVGKSAVAPDIFGLRWAKAGSVWH